MVPLVPSDHAKPLLALFSDPEKWQYLRDGPFDNSATYAKHLDRFLSQTAFASFVILENGLEDVLGKLSLLHADPISKKLEIGYVVFGDRLTGDFLGKQAVALLLELTFLRYGCEVCEWRCDARNAASSKFALKFFFRQKTRIENHMRVKGVDRDTLIFELSKGDWETNRQAITGLGKGPLLA